MGVQRTRTIKNKHAANGSGIKGSKASSRKPQTESVVNSKKSRGKAPVTTHVKGRPIISELLKKKKKKSYSEEELGIPKLNSIVPAGVQKPKGKKKGKKFVDDPESMNTILAIVQAERDGQIESKMMKARQLEEIREARRVEAEKKEEERRAKFDETKDSLRKKRKRRVAEDDEKINVKDLAISGSKATKSKKTKKVAFAEG